MALDISALQAEIARQTTVDAGILVLLAKFESLKGDPAAIQALVDSARANNDSLSDKLVENTPSESPV